MKHLTIHRACWSCHPETRYKFSHKYCCRREDNGHNDIFFLYYWIGYG